MRMVMMKRRRRKKRRTLGQGLVQALELEQELARELGLEWG